MKFRCLIAYCLLAACRCWSYSPLDPMRTNIHRADFAGIQFLVNQGVVAGLTNADGNTWITADSDPLGAITGALSTWNGVATSAARFVPVAMTTASNTPNDGRNVIVFADTPEIRSLLGTSVLALTTVVYTVPDGTIVDSDIIFNPVYTFSTSSAPNTLDLQAVLTHELGHALGANHTTVLGGTMFQTTPMNDNHQSYLSADDVTFVNSRYPAPGGNGNGILMGLATMADGSPIRGGAVTAIDPSTGIAIGSLTSLTDGTFEFQAPPGNYLVYVEPLAGYVQPANLNIPASQTVDIGFQASFLGGNDNPTIVPLTAAATISVNLQAAGPTPLFQAPYLGTGTAGGSNELVWLQRGPVSISSCRAIDLVLSGQGIDPLTEANLQILGGGISIRPGTLRQDTMTLGGMPVYRVTLDFTPAAAGTLGTMVLSKNSNLVTLTGVLAVGQPQVATSGGQQ